MMFKTLFPILLATTALADNEESFQKGNRAYALGQYENAITHYRQLIKVNRTSAALHYNLANAHHQVSRDRDHGTALGATQLGQAIYHYRLARRLSPRSRVVTDHLQQARERVHGQPPREPASRVLLGFLTLNEWAALASVCLTVWLSLMTAGCIRPAWRSAWRSWLPLLGGAALGFLLLAVLAWSTQSAGNEAVAIRETPVYKRPLEPSEVPAGIDHADPDPLRDGIELDILEHREDDWLKVAFADGVLQRSGWVRMGPERRPNLLLFPR